MGPRNLVLDMVQILPSGRTSSCTMDSSWLLLFSRAQCNQYHAPGHHVAAMKPIAKLLFTLATCYS